MGSIAKSSDSVSWWTYSINIIPPYLVLNTFAFSVHLRKVWLLSLVLMYCAALYNLLILNRLDAKISVRAPNRMTPLQIQPCLIFHLKLRNWLVMAPFLYLDFTHSRIAFWIAFKRQSKELESVFAESSQVWLAHASVLQNMFLNDL